MHYALYFCIKCVGKLLFDSSLLLTNSSWTQFYYSTLHNISCHEDELEALSKTFFVHAVVK